MADEVINEKRRGSAATVTTEDAGWSPVVHAIPPNGVRRNPSKPSRTRKGSFRTFFSAWRLAVVGGTQPVRFPIHPLPEQSVRVSSKCDEPRCDNRRSNVFIYLRSCVT